MIQKRIRVHEAAKHFGVCKNTIYNWVKKDLINYERIGSLIFIILKSESNEKK